MTLDCYCSKVCCPAVCRGKELFPTKFLDFLLSKPGDDEQKKKDALYQELKSVNDHLEKSGKPYFGGDDICATDLSMAPKIKHIKIGADEVKVCNCLHLIVISLTYPLSLLLSLSCTPKTWRVVCQGDGICSLPVQTSLLI